MCVCDRFFLILQTAFERPSAGNPVGASLALGVTDRAVIPDHFSRAALVH